MAKARRVALKARQGRYHPAHAVQYGMQLEDILVAYKLVVEGTTWHPPDIQLYPDIGQPCGGRECRGDTGPLCVSCDQAMEDYYDSCWP